MRKQFFTDSFKNQNEIFQKRERTVGGEKLIGRIVYGNALVNSVNVPSAVSFGKRSPFPIDFEPH